MKKLFLLFLLIPISTQADMVWPALYLASNMYNYNWLWVIVLGLFAEWPFYWLIAKRDWKQGAKLALVSNFVSAILGIILIPLSGLIWALTIEMALDHLIGLSTFHPGAWVGTVIFAAAMNSLVEATALRAFFKIKFQKRVLFLLLLANLISVTLAALTLLVDMPGE